MYTGLGAPLSEDGSSAGLRNVVFLKNVDDGQSAKNKEIVLVIVLHSVDILCSLRYKLNCVVQYRWMTVFRGLKYIEFLVFI